MKNLFTFLLIFSTAVLLTACKKSDSKDNATNFLTTAPWKATKVEWKATVSGNWIAKPGTSGGGTSETVTFFDNGSYVAWRLGHMAVFAR